MDQILGCDFGDVNNIVPFFEIDMCHMLKLARGFMCDESSFLDGSG